LHRPLLCPTITSTTKIHFSLKSPKTLFCVHLGAAI
jgi:hypothetical protein